MMLYDLVSASTETEYRERLSRAFGDIAPSGEAVLGRYDVFKRGHVSVGDDNPIGSVRVETWLLRRNPLERILGCLTVISRGT